MSFDPDLALARQLQAEEEQLARQELQQQATGAFHDRLVSGVSTVMKYEDAVLQAQALSVIPLDQLKEEAEERAESEAGKQDALVRALLLWFKRDFFSWVNNAPCESCGSTSTKSSGVASANEAEKARRAGTVETYTAVACSGDAIPSHHEYARAYSC
eukprot:1306281-Pyramimonas_sp.AAC.1